MVLIRFSFDDAGGGVELSTGAVAGEDERAADAGSFVVERANGTATVDDE